MPFALLPGKDILSREPRKEMPDAQHVLVILDDEFEMLAVEPEAHNCNGQLLHKLATAACESPFICRVLATGFNRNQIASLREELGSSVDKNEVCFVCDIWAETSRDGALVIDSHLLEAKENGGWGVPGRQIAIYSYEDSDEFRKGRGLGPPIQKPLMRGRYVSSKENALRGVSDGVAKFLDGCFRGVPLATEPTNSKSMLSVYADRNDKKKQIFVIGGFDQKITIYSQQVRALTLVRALCQEQLVTGKSRVAVIGGGFAGLTAASACHLAGSSVILYERASLLHHQHGADHRYVHPHIYHWPSSGSARLYAGLPILSWKAGSAREVTEQILRQFYPFTEPDANGRKINVLPGKRVSNINRLPGGRVRVELDAAGQDEMFDIVLCAVGFGLDQQHGDVTRRGHSYWDDDGLSKPQSIGPTGARLKILISGTGDGGLIDLARCCLMDIPSFEADHSSVSWHGFSHQAAVENLLTLEDVEEAALHMQKIDEDRELESRKGVEGSTLYRRYRDRLTSLTERLTQRIIEYGRPDTDVTLVFRTETSFARTQQLSIVCSRT